MYLIIHSFMQDGERGGVPHLAQCVQSFCGFVTRPRPQPPHSTQRGKSAGVYALSGDEVSASSAILSSFVPVQ